MNALAELTATGHTKAGRGLVQDAIGASRYEARRRQRDEVCSRPLGKEAPPRRKILLLFVSKRRLQIGSVPISANNSAASLLSVGMKRSGQPIV
jgi:hypothetical protein